MLGRTRHLEAEHITLVGALVSMKAPIARITRKLSLIIFLGLLSAFSFEISASASDRVNRREPTDLANGVEAQPAVVASRPSTSDQGAVNAQALVSPATESANTPGPRFFLLIGLVLIGARLIIAYRSRKVKNLATETH